MISGFPVVVTVYLHTGCSYSTNTTNGAYTVFSPPYYMGCVVIGEGGLYSDGPYFLFKLCHPGIILIIHFKLDNRSLVDKTRFQQNSGLEVA